MDASNSPWADDNPWDDDVKAVQDSEWSKISSDFHNVRHWFQPSPPCATGS